jgi:2-C-methyl-D-erythritol 4-phosphate cytidylyltransferase
MTDPVWGVVAAAGAGLRFGGQKQFLELGGRPLVEWAVEGTRSVADGVVLVVPPELEAETWLASWADLVVPGGASRAESVRAGLRAVPADATIVVVHDAARPLATQGLFRSVVAAVDAGADGAVPGLPVVDTVKSVDRGVVRSTLDRSHLVRVQTPQAFRAAVLRRAHEGDPDATDDAALVEAQGGSVVVVPGEEANLKVTSADDLALLEWRLASRAAPGAGP